MERDGYYITTAICLVVGLLCLVTYITPTVKRIQGLCILYGSVSPPTDSLSLARTALPLSKWRTTIA
jgi:hypothetical protein